MKGLASSEVMIENKIFTIRGKKVILDNDLAELYGVSTKRLNEQVKRNKERFPEDFMFQLTEDEKAKVVANCDHLKKMRFSSVLPYAFTEHGTIQAANVLNSERAVEMGIAVVRAFVKMRELIAVHKDLTAQLDEVEKRYDTRFKFVFDAIKKLIDSPMPEMRKPIDFLNDEQKSGASSRRIAVTEGGLIYVNNMKLSGPGDAAGIFYDLKNQDREKFVTLMLDKNDEILGCEVVSIGTLNASLVHPREVLKIPVSIGAAKIVLMHNHPSGIYTPSEEDIAITQKLSRAAELVGIEVLYHIIIGRDKYCVFNTSTDSVGRLIKTPEVYPIIRYESQVITKKQDKQLFAKQIRSPADVVEFALPFFDKDKPLAIAILLDTKKNVISVQMLGSQYDESWAGKLLRTAVLANAANYIICGNYYIGDENFKTLSDSSKIIDIPLIDYVKIVDKYGQYTSKASEGQLDELTQSNTITINDSARYNGQGGKIMLKVAEGVCKGTYVARITGVDEKFGLKREFLHTDLKFTKKGVADVLINPELLKEGDIIALKIVRPGETAGKENFYRIVGNPEDARALHNIVKKIPGGKEDIVEKIFAKESGKGGADHDLKGKLSKEEILKKHSRDNIERSRVDIGLGEVDADSKSYVAKITGADEKYGLKREFISRIVKNKQGGAELVFDASNLKEGDIIAIKDIEPGKVDTDKGGKEKYWRVVVEPQPAWVDESFEEITKEQVMEVFDSKSKAAVKKNTLQEENEQIVGPAHHEAVGSSETAESKAADETTKSAVKAKSYGRTM